jgi:hypothetical protein
VTSWLLSIGQHRGRLLLLGVLAVVLSMAAGHAGLSLHVQAANAITVNGTPTVDNQFPNSVAFGIDASSSAGKITDVSFHFQLLPTGNPASGDAQFDSDATVHAVYTLRTSGNTLYLPPTKVIRYYWLIQDSAGNRLQTDPVDWMYQDTRFQFKTATNGNLTLYYVCGSDANAKRLLDVGRAALDKAGALNGVPIDFPVHLVTYATQAQVQPALSHESKASDPNILGQADAPDIVVLVAGDLTGAENEDTVRHELTHLVNARAVEGRQTLPLWLDEGLAVYGQNDPGGFGDAVAQAIRQNKVVPITSLAPSLRGTDAGLFYGEAWSITSFLVKTYGQEKFAQLLAAFKGGASEDQAFTMAFGLDRNGVYNAWRKSVGLSEVAAPAAAPARNASAPQPPAATQQSDSNSNTQPTVAAPPQPSSASSGTSTSSDNVTPIVLGIVGGIVVIALLSAAVVGGLMLSRRGNV